MKLKDKIYTGLIIRLYLAMKKSHLFKNTIVLITGGFLKNYKWSLHTSDETYLSGNFDNDTLDELKKHLQACNIVYDLGANEGYYSLIAAKLTGNSGYVYAFEPLPENVSKIKRHVQLNNINNISIIDKAVSDKTGVLIFSNTNDQAGNTYIDSSPKFKESSNKIEIKSISLDDFCSVPGNKAPHLLKIDVEGAEYDVLCGAKKTIEKHQPVIVLATHDFHVKGVKDKCIDFLTELGYVNYKLNNHSSTDFSDFVFYSVK